MSREKTGKDTARKRKSAKEFSKTDFLSSKCPVAYRKGYLVKQLAFEKFPKRSNDRFGLIPNRMSDIGQTGLPHVTGCAVYTQFPIRCLYIMYSHHVIRVCRYEARLRHALFLVPLRIWRMPSLQDANTDSCFSVHILATSHHKFPPCCPYISSAHLAVNLG